MLKKLGDDTEEPGLWEALHGEMGERRFNPVRCGSRCGSQLRRQVPHGDLAGAVITGKCSPIATGQGRSLRGSLGHGPRGCQTCADRREFRLGETTNELR